jgi:hypothetical protein
MTLTAARARECLDYNAETGAFVWKIARKGTLAGSASASSRPDGYRRIGVDGRLYYAHRVAHLMMTGEWPSGLIDHINGDPSDNRWCNLRPATQSQNLCNRAGVSGLKGACFMRGRGRWRATIQVGGVQRSLGTFATEAEAHAAYVIASADAHGAFSKTTTNKKAAA